MRRCLQILLILCMLTPNVCFAAEGYETPIALCYEGDAYSIDYVFEVAEEVTDVIVNESDCYYDWNYVADEAKLYISFAAGKAIAPKKTIATLISDEELSLISVSVVVNGKIRDNVSAFHTEIDIDAVKPTIETAGSSSGKVCESCGMILVVPEVLPAKGPSVGAVLDDTGTLSVSAQLSDSPEAVGITYIAVYNESNQMIALKDATDFDQTDFSMEFEQVADAHTVKVFRFAATNLKPLYQAAETIIEKE